MLLHPPKRRETGIIKRFQCMLESIKKQVFLFML